MFMKKTLLLLLFITTLIFAVPANPDPAVVTYPDGRTLTVYLRGDENLSWHESADGKALVKTGSETFDYALQNTQGKLISSGVRAHDIADREDTEKDFVSTLPTVRLKPETLKSIPAAKSSGAPSAFPFEQTNFPTLGEQNFLVILVEFSDKAFTHRPEDFDSLMNGKNYTYNGAFGSVSQYYRDGSFERFKPHFDIAGPVRLDSSWAYYGKGNNEVNIQEFVYEAVTKADSLVDFSQYDNNSDGFVDNIYFIYAGYGQCFSGADENTIWPHRWAYIDGTLIVDGKRVYDYSTSMEFYGVSGTTRTSIGVIAHEFGHVCGLPDYYDTDYEGSGGDCGGLGAWDLMAGGSWNDNGKRPPMFNGSSRVYLRWAEPGVLDGTEFVTLNPANTHNEVRYFTPPTPGEYFMLENRQRTGWDAAIPGHGLLIFHIDMNHPGWNDNTLNCNPYRQGFDLEEADGQGNISASYINAGDPFPGASGNHYFLDEGSPNALSWTGEPSRKPIRNIQEDEGVITFSFGDKHVDTPENFEAVSLSGDSIRLSWRLNADADSVMIVYAEEDSISYPLNGQQYEIGENAADAEVLYKGIDTVFYHSGLDAGNEYHYGIFSFEDSAYTYSKKSLVTVKTKSPDYYSEDFAEDLPAGWEIVDHTGNGSWTWENPLSRNLESVSADNGFMIIDSEHLGDVKLDADLITRSFNFALSRSVVLYFEHKLEVETITLARLLYTVNDGHTWYEAKRWIADTDGTEICELDLTEEVSGFRDVKFKFNFRGTNQKYWCIDDFRIFSGLNPGVSAAFHSTQRSGSKPLVVHFMNTSVSEPGEIDTMIWDFGDNDAFVSDHAPTHTYTRSGSYTVSLMTRSGELQSNYSREAYIIVRNDPPEYIAESDTVNIRMNTENSFNLRSFFIDPNGDPLSFSWSGNSNALQIEAENDSVIRILPDEDYLGIETVRFIAEDNEGDTVSQELDIWVSETGTAAAIPVAFDLQQNFPNPFNPQTRIRYQLPRDEFVNLDIFDMRGRRIAGLVNREQRAGFYGVNFDANTLPAGIYFYRLRAGSYVKTRKMLLIK
jgi:M6 family metalloprotease-like protein